MVWEPFALAVVFGLLISAGIYFIVMWPQVAPDDDLPDALVPAVAVPETEVAAATPVAVVEEDPPASTSPSS